MEDNIAFEKLQYFQNLKINCDFFRLNIVVSISTHVKYQSNIALVLHLYKIGLYT